MSVPIPTGAGDLTPEWFTAALAGGVARNARVVAIEMAAVGTGQIADSVRVALTWEPPGAGPATLVTKVTSASETSRGAAMATRTYEVEVGFYTDLASDLPVHAPRCHWAGHDPATGAYAVVLDDMAPAVAGDQVAGCSVDEAALALDEAALLHGARWGDAELSKLSWLDRGGLAASEGLVGFVQSLLPGFLDRYGDRLSPGVVDLCGRVPDVVAAAAAYDPGPRTVVHNDFRNDNLLFGGDRVCVLDWQTVSLGPALIDVSYFLGGSLLTDDRREHEATLVRRYREQLVGQGVDLSWDACWDGYRRYTLAGLVMAIIASMLVVRTDRGDAMFVAMADRAGMHAIDLETEALVGGS
ncbi:MAG TPA: phosphotransferase [Acidimicrobiales bacterium]